MKPKCEDCYYWEHKHSEPKGGQGRTNGICHRWPETLWKYGHEWCGEFINRKEPESGIEWMKKFYPGCH